MRKRRKWNLSLQSLFFIQLGKLLEKGYSLSQAIEFLQIQQSPSRQEDLQICLAHLRAGSSLHEALAKIDFHCELIGYLFFAEQHGQIAYALMEAGNMAQMKVRYMEQLRKMMRYPFFLLSFSIIMFLAFQQVLLPQFSHLSSSFQVRSSSFSIVVLAIASSIPNFFFFLFLFFMLLFLVYFVYVRKLPLHTQIKILMNIPIVRQLVISLHSQLFSLQLSHLLKGGLSIYEALQVFERQSHLPLLQAEAKAIKDRLCEGEKLDQIIQSRNYYEEELAHVIRHGQSNGELVQELFHYSQFSLQKIENRLMKIIHIVQPTLLIIIGLFVVLMYMAILWPMFQLMNHL
ncbi:competence type IV pilus assembly protein ComGB [Thermolongibacillus altinsuensis]|uniref:competence type IV pilus assembly protein ComGB n=1 Tax=Thermolongibacillus altinsuensis TaxID=575256 RepID=UPI00242A32AF|nr:competence type IV pilus assembly protein ComGB [Thermolongibacillus altinsuensis]GMB07640.1 competence protein ComG [Thermolongibacillus altinsuensis]